MKQLYAISKQTRTQSKCQHAALGGAGLELWQRAAGNGVLGAEQRHSAVRNRQVSCTHTL